MADVKGENLRDGVSEFWETVNGSTFGLAVIDIVAGQETRVCLRRCRTSTGRQSTRHVAAEQG